MEKFEEYVTITGPYRFFGDFWNKHFAQSPDGITNNIMETHIDEEIKNTWRNTPSKNMNAVELGVNGYIYKLQLPSKKITQFWQSDDYEAVPGKNTKKIRRRVQMRIKEGWLTLEVDLETRNHKLYLAEKKI